MLHGGPGAPGQMAPVARTLSHRFHVIEPLQRLSGGERLSVARHVADLHELIEGYPGRPALVGSSWGAMLALAYAAEHPRSAGPLVLIGCGTFDSSARAFLESTVAARMDAELRRKLERLEHEVPDEDERFGRVGALLAPLYSWDLEESGLEGVGFDARGHLESWNDMLRLQAQGVYPAAFSRIQSPVLMLHGADDPHPGRRILAGLKQYLAQIEYRECDHCGHFPWLEREVREDFYRVLADWLGTAIPRTDT